jgi:WD40 repeat protein
VQKLSAPTGVRWLAFGADGNLGVGTQKQVAVVDPGNGSQLFTSPGNRIKYENGRWLAVAADGTSIYDVKTGQPLAQFPKADGEVVASSDGLSEITMSILHSDVRWAGKKSEYIDVPSIGSEGTGHVSAIANSPTGFVVGTNDGIVILLSATGSPKLFATDHSRIDSLVVSRDGKLLVVGDSSGVVTMWDLQ